MHGPDLGRICSRCAAQGEAVIHCEDCGGFLCKECDRKIHIIRATEIGMECLFHARNVITREAATDRIHRAPLPPASFVISVDSQSAASKIDAYPLLAPLPACPLGCGRLMTRDSVIVDGNVKAQIQIVTPSIGIVKALVTYLRCDHCRVSNIDPRLLYVRDRPSSTVASSIHDSGESLPLRSPSSSHHLPTHSPHESDHADHVRIVSTSPECQSSKDDQHSSHDQEQHVAAETPPPSSGIHHHLDVLGADTKCDDDLVVHFAPHGYFPAVTGYVEIIVFLSILIVPCRSSFLNSN